MLVLDVWTVGLSDAAGALAWLASSGKAVLSTEARRSLTLEVTEQKAAAAAAAEAEAARAASAAAAVAEASAAWKTAMAAPSPAAAAPKPEPAAPAAVPAAPASEPAVASTLLERGRAALRSDPEKALLVAAVGVTLSLGLLLANPRGALVRLLQG